MNSGDSYRELARAYADAVQVLFAPEGQAAGERGGRGPASYAELTDQGERLGSISAQLTEEGGRRLAGAKPEERMSMETALLAKTLIDLQISDRMLRAARDEEERAEFGAGTGPERGGAFAAAPDSYVGLLFVEGATDTGAQERSLSTPGSVGAARAELMMLAGDTLSLVSERCGNMTKTTLDGLTTLGLAEAGRAIGLVGMDLADALGQADKVTKLYDLFGQFLVKAYDSLLVLAGPKLLKLVGERVMEWLESLRSGERIDELLERLYETEETKEEVGLWIREREAEVDDLVAALQQTGDLGDAFRKQTDLTGKILSGVKYLALVPASVLPQGKLLLGAVYAVICCYVVFMGADYVDARKLKRLDRVPGVRRIVKAHIVAP